MCKLRVLRAIGHIEDDIETPTMQIPDLTDISEETLKDAALIKSLEDILMTWEVHITKIIEDCLKKVRNNARLVGKIRIKIWNKVASGRIIIYRANAQFDVQARVLCE